MHFPSKFVYLSLIPNALALSVRDDACPSDATTTVTIAQPTVSTATVTTGAASTSYVFLPDNPPPIQPGRRKKRSPCKAGGASSAATSAITSASTASTITTSALSSSVSAVITSSIIIDSTDATSASSSTTTEATTSGTSADITTAVATTTSTCPPTSIITVTATTLSASTTTTVVPFPASTSTIYPCATPIVNFQGQAYGDASGTSNLGVSNQLFNLNTPQGASVQACCNTCFFEVPNCVQAYFYSYQGCVVSAATVLTTASGQGVSSSCPAGTFNGLSYGPDVAPAFRSTGNIAGPCGQVYTNL